VVYNQFVDVDPVRALTTMKLPCNRAYRARTDEATNHEIETTAFLRSMADHRA